MNEAASAVRAGDNPAKAGAADAHFDVLIVGAGLSGIGAACHLVRKRPKTTFAILEARDAIGGTWDLFRYPGHPLGFRHVDFRLRLSAVGRRAGDRRWTVNSTLSRRHRQEYGVDRRIRFGHRVVGASWRSEEARWTLDVSASGGETLRLSCNFLFLCAGYYEYAEGYMPGWPGMERFGGRIVHPQKWPEDLRYAGKRVVVIGSGATAVTLVPAMAETAAHVMMLQRSPTYVVARPSEEAMAKSFGLAPGPARPRHRALEEHCSAALSFPPVAEEAGGRAGESSSSRRPRSDRESTPPSTSTRATSRGTNAFASSRTATCSRRCAPARRRSSPARSKPSPRPESV